MSALQSILVLLLWAMYVASSLGQAPDTGEPATLDPQPLAEQEKSTDAEPPASFSFPAKQHAWARFPLDSWREVEITSESFDADGNVLNSTVTRQREKLQAVDDDKYVLTLQATIDMDGKQIVGTPLNRVFNLATDDPSEILESRRLPPESFSLDGRSLECEVWEVVQQGDRQRQVDRLVYHPEVFPYVLRSETRPENERQVLSPHFARQVIQNHTPFLRDGRILSCAVVKSLQQGEKGATSSLGFLSPEVPGAELASWSTELDPAGRRVRWSVLRLVDFHITADQEAQ